MGCAVIWSMIELFGEGRLKQVCARAFCAAVHHAARLRACAGRCFAWLHLGGAVPPRARWGSGL